MKNYLKNSILAIALFTVSGFAIGAGRNVAIDDSPGFDSTGKIIRGISWRETSPRGSVSTPPALDLRGDGSLVQPTTFNLNFGTVNVLAGQSAMVTENGQLYLGDQSLPLNQRGQISLFAGKDLFASAPGQYTASVGISGTYFGYSLGEYVGARGDLLQQVGTVTVGGQTFPEYSPTVVAPDGAGRISRFTWFGMTDAPDSCSTSKLLNIYSNPAIYNNSFVGTDCYAHLTTPRYFGQVTLVDVGTREDGDFDLYLDYGTPTIFRTSISTFQGTFVPVKTLFGEVSPYPGSPKTFASEFATTVGPTPTSGFLLGNQKFEFGGYDASTSPDVFHFRGGVACAAIFDSAGNEIGCNRVIQVGDTTGNVPTPGIALLLTIGGIGFAGVKRTRAF